MKIICYVRVSTDQQAESGLGIEGQLTACYQYAERIGKKIDMVFRDEGKSGSLPPDKRPAMTEAISSLKKGDIFLVAKRDRLGRDESVLFMIKAAIKKKGARIVSAAGEGTENDEPSSVLMQLMVDGFAIYERLLIGSRTKSALQEKKKKNERVGYIPFGYQLAEDGVHLVENETEQEVAQELLALHEQGKSFRKIAKEMNKKKKFNRGLAFWNHASCHRIIRSTKLRLKLC